MPRTCTVCNHPDRETIDQMLVGNGSVSYRTIANRYGITKSALLRHRAKHLPATLTKAKDAQEVAAADNILAELQKCFDRVSLLFDACDRWLRDPDDPTRYEIGPRAEDVKVTYTTQEVTAAGNYRTVRHKARLSALLEKINAAHNDELTFTLVETKHADPRELVLKASERLEGQLELIARLVGELQDKQTVNILVMPEWVRLRAIIMQALEPYPDVRALLAGRLLEAERDPR